MLQGTIHPDFSDVATTMRRILPSKGPGGAAVCVYHKGEKVVDVWGGTRDKEGSPWEEDTISISFSTTKGVASTLLHIYADRGLIDYDKPVREYWPEFGQAGKENLTVRQLMCHEAGLYAISEMVDHASEMLDWDQMIARLSAARPRHAPGTAHGYHGLTYGWLVGEIVRRVTGNQKTFAELIDASIARPLGLDGLYCGVPADQMFRCAELMAPAFDLPPEKRKRNTQKSWDNARLWGKRLSKVGIRYNPVESLEALIPPGMDELSFNDEAFRAASIPAANGMFTARSLARMYACLAQGGELDGIRLLSHDAIRQASEEQNRGAGRVIPISMRWRLGYHRVFAVLARVPAGFGHFGFGGSGAWADPQRQLSVALTVNSGVGTPFGDSRIARIGGAAVRAADRR
ncbi:MAG: serine hydrolase [Candidatus Binatia bacterium]|nr:serine hydrolase [Candidatus Binatia bacterium]